MNRSTLASALISMVCMTTIPGFAQTSAQKKICDSKKSAIATEFCYRLSEEFAGKRLLDITESSESNDQKRAEVAANSLIDPTSDTVPLVTALFKQAYAHIIANTIAGDAKSLAQNDAQIIANTLAQMISTKAAVDQTGASSGASASTSLVQKPTTTDLISLAAESGAFTDTVNGNTVTAQANVDGLIRYMTNQTYAATTKTAEWEDLLQHSSLSATFNVAQAGSAVVPTMGQATTSTPTSIASVLLPSNNVSFNGAGISIQFMRPYTPTGKAFQSAWDTALAAQQPQINVATSALYNDTVAAMKNLPPQYTSDPLKTAVTTWETAATAAEKRGDDAAFSDFVDGFVSYMDVVVAVLEKDPNFDQNAVRMATDLQGLRNLRQTVIDKARGSLATITYNYTTPANKPAEHTATAVLGYVWKGGEQITANLGGDWFATIPRGATYSRVKDYQLSGEFDWQIGKGVNGDNTVSRATASLAGYGQYQYTANVLNITVANVAPGTNISVPANSQVFTSTPGWLGVTQAKLVFNIGKGATIPIAVKWSNKTDLLTGSSWKGQFGFNYDLSALKSILLGGTSTQ